MIITTKLTANQLSALGYNIKAMSSGGYMLVQSFIATHKGRRVHGWYSHKNNRYEITKD